MALAAASGQVSLDKLAEERVMLEGMRELCSTAYRRAFPADRASGDPSS